MERIDAGSAVIRTVSGEFKRNDRSEKQPVDSATVNVRPSATTDENLRAGCPMALAVGMANREVEFVFPTSEEMGHPSVELCRGTSP